MEVKKGERARRIRISDGTEVLVDESDYEWLSRWKWSAHGRGYAVRGEHIGDRKYKYFKMHREIIGAEPGQIVDHINGDKRDNRKSNLRIATPSQNAVNSREFKRKIKSPSSKYRGVCYEKRRSAWKAEIRIGPGKRKHLGQFKGEIDAAKAYNEAAIKYHGEFATLNKLKEEVD